MGASQKNVSANDTSVGGISLVSVMVEKIPVPVFRVHLIIECVSVKGSSVGGVSQLGLPLWMIGIERVLLPRAPLSRIPLCIHDYLFTGS